MLYKINFCNKLGFILETSLFLKNLKVVKAKFSTLGLSVFVMSEIVSYRQARLYLELKTWPRLAYVCACFFIWPRLITGHK